MGEIILEVKDLFKSFSNGEKNLQVLSGFSLQVEAGKINTIMGQSGSGKSTAMNIMGTLDSPDSGEVIIDGNDIKYITDDALSEFRNRKLGFVFQFHHLLPEFTALENILMPLWIGNNSESMENNALMMLEKVGLLERQDHFPSQLSGGERSRVAVLRALINNPRLILADEPTGNLDQKNALKLIDLLLEINRDFQQAIVLTTHNPEVAAIGHRQFTLENGNLSERV